jgi:hypothetical protein
MFVRYDVCEPKENILAPCLTTVREKNPALTAIYWTKTFQHHLHIQQVKPNIKCNTLKKKKSAWMLHSWQTGIALSIVLPAPASKSVK